MPLLAFYMMIVGSTTTQPTATQLHNHIIQVHLHPLHSRLLLLHPTRFSMRLTHLTRLPCPNCSMLDSKLDEMEKPTSACGDVGSRRAARQARDRGPAPAELVTRSASWKCCSLLHLHLYFSRYQRLYMSHHNSLLGKTCVYPRRRAMHEDGGGINAQRLPRSERSQVFARLGRRLGRRDVAVSAFWPQRVFQAGLTFLRINMLSYSCRQILAFSPFPYAAA